VDDVWNARFGDASGWRFVLAGDLDVTSAADLVRSYLGTLEGSGTAERFVDREPPLPPAVVATEVHVGTGDRASVTRAYTVDIAAADLPTTNLLTDLLTSVLNSRLTAKLREELGASYSPTAQAYVQLTPTPTAELVLQVTGAPDGVAQLRDVLQHELDDLAANGPTDQESADAFAEVGRSYEYIDNDSIAVALLSRSDWPEAFTEYLADADTLAGLDDADLARFAGELLTPDRYRQVTVLPG